MRATRFSAAIFDFDETMFDLEVEHGLAAAALAEARGADYLSLPRSFRERSGSRVIDDVREMKEFFGWNDHLDDLYRERQRIFSKICEERDLAPLPGVDRSVTWLAGAGLRLAVTTSAVREPIESILSRSGLLRYFELIVAGDDVTRGKPDPEPYRVTAAKLGLAPERCIVFEDSAIGVASARAAGAYCVAVRNPRAQTHQDLSEAILVVESFEDIDLDMLVSGRVAR